MISVIPAPKSSASQNVTALKAAITASTYSGQLGGSVVVGPGDYLLDQPIELRNIWGLRFLGAGLATRFIWRGASDQPMFRMVHSRQCELSNFQAVYDTNAGYAAVQLLRDNQAGSTITPTYNRCVNLLINGANLMTHGVVLGGTGSVDANNEFNSFGHVQILDYVDSGFYVNGLQSYNNQMSDCSLRAGTSGQYGVRTDYGSFAWRGGSMNANKAADFLIGRSSQPYTIDSYNSEGSARLLEVPSTTLTHVTVRNSRFAGNALHADKKVMLTNGRIHLTVSNCSIGDGASPTDDLTFHFVNTVADDGISGVLFENNVIYSTASNLWNSRAPHMLTRNIKITDEVQRTSELITS